LCECNAVKTRGFDRVADVYDETRSLDRAVMERIVSRLAERFSGCSFLDVGVGTGRFAAPIAEAGLEVAGIDVSRLMIERARAKGVADLVIADVESVPFVQGSFDYALSVHFLHLVRDWRKTVAEMVRVSRRGVVSVVEEPEGVRPRDMYVELREGMGFPMSGLKRGERDLASAVSPSMKEEVARYRKLFRPAELLSEYRARLHSVTWDVPEEVNEEIVKRMAEGLGGERVVERSVVLLCWERERLASLHPSA